MTLGKGKAIAEVREHGIKKIYSLLKQKLEIEMKLEQHEISTELEEIKILQKKVKEMQKNCWHKMLCAVYAGSRTRQ